MYLQYGVLYLILTRPKFAVCSDRRYSLTEVVLVMAGLEEADVPGAGWQGLQFGRGYSGKGSSARGCSGRGCSALQRQNAENLKQIFPEKEYRGLRPNFHIHVSVSELNIPTMGLPFLLEEICGTILGIYKSLKDT
jgi:hypothetical protein